MTNVRPKALLFACTRNAVRSPMAEALARQVLGRQTYIASVGVRPTELDAFAVAVMDEVGLDIADHRPQGFEDIEDTSFDVIVTLSPEAHHWALELTRTMAVQVVHWPTADPTVAIGARDQVLDAYRAVRDSLWKRIRETFGLEPMGST